MRRLVLALALVTSALSTAAPARSDSTATVRVDGNAFAPFEAAVDVNGTVSWLVQEGGHTIAADDGRFKFRGTNGSALPAGTSVSFAFGADEFVAYHCEIHGGPGGQGMAGRVRVGAPPAPAPYPEPLIRVPADAPTLAAAVAVAAPGYRIVLAPGDHPVVEPVEVAVDKLTIAGTDATTRLVPVAGPRGFPSTALRLTGSHVRVERLRIGAFRASGVHLDGANAAEVLDVHVDGAGFMLDGIVATAVTGAAVRATTTTGNRRAGVRVADCAACGVLIDGVQSSYNKIGLHLEAVRGVTVRRSAVNRNASGIVAGANRLSAPLRHVTVSLLDNIVTDNTDGVRISGASDTLVTRNVVGGAFTWDGVGRNVTFVNNRDPAGARREPALDPTASLR